MPQPDRIKSRAAREPVLDAYDRGFLDGIRTAADQVAEPYPENVFTPMTEEEVGLAVAAMNEAVPHASERMHAAWARRIAKWLSEAAETAL